MKTNFAYLSELGLEELHRYCSRAEEYQKSDPAASVTYARNALEYLVRSLYAMKHVEISERASLFELTEGETYRDFIGDDTLMMNTHYVRKAGNRGAHGEKISPKESFFCLLDLYNVVGAVLTKFLLVSDLPPFDKALIPDGTPLPVVLPQPSEAPKPDTIPGVPKEALASQEPAKPFALPPDLTEAETRRLYVDMMLKDAGWELLEEEGAIEPSKACIEVRVEGMPNGKKEGFCDYVLFGPDAKPLAVIEVKRTSYDPEKGKHQAELYADCLEAAYGVRPVIYYTSGFHTKVIDGLGYPPREVFAFHSADDLSLLIQKRRDGGVKLKDFDIKETITDREYQRLAIKAVAEHFDSMHRRALLVMATGTGKTRVSASLAELLMRNERVKNVLFLADRTALVRQAATNFGKLLPQTSQTILSDRRGNREPDLTARITFSTYQTLIRMVDTDRKPYSAGHFDLIIVDEAHRSVFGKYGAIFKYFDSLLVGLTATPREDVARSTYDLFGREHGEPNFDYSLEKAVDDGYLVPPRNFSRGSLVLDNGIRYDALSEEEKEQLEEVWKYEQAQNALDPGFDPDLYARDIAPDELFSYIYNVDTVDKVLQDLMEHGLKVAGGDKIGKTIIFAFRHDHAELIVERFRTLYPGLGSSFCDLIDNTVNYAQDLINRFEGRETYPQIAVSVDMLDTGIDVPDVLNLVFFKRVRSKIKFWQMIGRGTRLSPDIFGPGMDKEEFYIFDWCRNFEYFSMNPDGKEPKPTRSLTEQLFALRCEIAKGLQAEEWQEDDCGRKLCGELKKMLLKEVSELSDNLVSVRNVWEAVSRFKKEERWVSLSDEDLLTLSDKVAPVLPKVPGDEGAKRFDLLMLAIEVALLNPEKPAGSAIQRVQTIADALLQKTTIPQIKKELPLLKEVLSDESWTEPELCWLEKVRLRLRELMQFLEGEEKRHFTVDVADTVTLEGEAMQILTPQTYRQNILDYLALHQDLPVLKKIYNLEQLTAEDEVELERILWHELGTKEDYVKYYPEKEVGVLIRSLSGFDKAKARELFKEIARTNSLNFRQEEFLDSVINYIFANGDLTARQVANDPPFSDRLANINPYGSYLGEYLKRMRRIITPQIYPDINGYTSAKAAEDIDK